MTNFKLTYLLAGDVRTQTHEVNSIVDAIIQSGVNVSQIVSVVEVKHDEKQSVETVLSVLAYVDVNDAKKSLKWVEKMGGKSDQQKFAKKCFDAYIAI